MAKTPEELTEDWLNNKLQAGSFWFVETEDSNPEPMVVDMDGDFNDYEGNYYRPSFSNGKLKVLAPVPSYDEYKAIQEELAEHRHYCCCMENEVMRLELAKLEEENKQLRALLKECLNIVKHDLWQQAQFPDGQIVDKDDLLTRINEALK